MCDLRNGVINYGSKMSREEAERRLQEVGAKPDMFGDYWFSVELTQQQKDYFKERLPSHYSYLRGKVRASLDESNIVVDGDVMAFDTICGLRDVAPYPFCDHEQTTVQQKELYRLAEIIRETVGE